MRFIASGAAFRRKHETPEGIRRKNSLLITGRFAPILGGLREIRRGRRRSSGVHRLHYRQGRYRHHHPGDEVSYDARYDACEKRDENPDEAYHGGVYVHVFGYTATNARDLAIDGRAHQALLNRRGSWGSHLLRRSTVVAEIGILGG